VPLIKQRSFTGSSKSQKGGIFGLRKCSPAGRSGAFRSSSMDSCDRTSRASTSCRLMDLRVPSLGGRCVRKRIRPAPGDQYTPLCHGRRGDGSVLMAINAIGIVPKLVIQPASPLRSHRGSVVVDRVSVHDVAGRASPSWPGQTALSIIIFPGIGAGCRGDWASCRACDAPGLSTITAFFVSSPGGWCDGRCGVRRARPGRILVNYAKASRCRHPGLTADRARACR